MEGKAVVGDPLVSFLSRGRCAGGTSVHSLAYSRGDDGDSLGYGGSGGGDSSLGYVKEGISPSSIKEAIGFSGVEQNRIVVAAKVQDSLVQSNFDPVEKEKVIERLRRYGDEEVPGLVYSCCSPLGKLSCRGKVATVHRSILLSMLLHGHV
ncbi:hypothetical protein NE237_030346 [Protea cynaroides]|uniref:Rubisco accumulation factor 1 helix turn helix domain-containing protein n=1 Tax=Protea cynaroides TaxID=273540 RepID=A0A9Q0GXN6_9MAGN|nr:hypothetical protein NE237_030346 [Protea cynaroides]